MKSTEIIKTTNEHHLHLLLVITIIVSREGWARIAITRWVPWWELWRVLKVVGICMVHLPEYV